MSDARKDFRLEGVAVGEADHASFIPFSLAYGTSPSGKPVPIRVDEDGYVMLHSAACDCITDEKSEARIAELETQLSATNEAFDGQRAAWAKRLEELTHNDPRTAYRLPTGLPTYVLRYSGDPPLGKRRDVVTQEVARAEFAEYGWVCPEGIIAEYNAPGPLPEKYAKS